MGVRHRRPGAGQHRTPSARRISATADRDDRDHARDPHRPVLRPLETRTIEIGVGAQHAAPLPNPMIALYPSILVALTLQNADTTAPAVAVESPYTIHSGALELGGTLTLPRGATGRIPVAVIIAGSGPTDRNGNSLMGIRPNSYAQLAWRLAERGIATLRYDKRVFPGTKGTVDISRLTLDDFAADARAAAESLARDGRFSPVVLLGHSEGSALGVLFVPINQTFMPEVITAIADWIL